MNEVDAPKEAGKAPLIRALQHRMAELPQVELETKHHFAGGMYARELFRPAGTLIVGKTHRHEHLFIVVSGTVDVAGDEGVSTYTGPCVITSKPGTKRATYARTDAVCITVHRTDLTDLDEIEKEVIVPDPDAPVLFDAHNKLLGETKWPGLL